MATKKVFGVELVLVDLEVLHGAMEAEQLPINGSAVEDVKTYVKWTKVNVSKEKLAQCDNCGGDSDYSLPRCPYCGVAGVEADEGAPPPAFETLPKASEATKPEAAKVTKPKASEARKAKAKTPPAQEILIEQVPGAPHGSDATGSAVDSESVKLAEVLPIAKVAPLPDVPIPTQSMDVEVGEAIPGLTIEEGIKRVGAAKSAAVTSYWDLGDAILNCYRGDLWKQMRDEQGLPMFRSFKSFCEGALQMNSQYAYKVMQVANSYTRQDVEQVDASKLGAMLRLPEGERQKLLDETKEKKLSLREVTNEVKERSKGLPAQPGAGKTGPRGAANSAGKDDEAPKQKAKKETHTLTVVRRTRVQLFHGKNFKSGAPENKRAKRLADMPVGEFETLNGQKVRVVLSQDAKGMVLAIEVMK